MASQYVNKWIQNENESKDKDIENNIWISINNRKIIAIADEDLERSTDDKTSAVHFLRFQLDQNNIADFLSGDDIRIGVSHPAYTDEVLLEKNVISSLAKDLKAN